MRGCLPNSYTLYSNLSEISIGNEKFLSFFYNCKNEKPKNLTICRLPRSAKVKQSNRKFCMWRECFFKAYKYNKGAPLPRRATLFLFKCTISCYAAPLLPRCPFLPSLALSTASTASRAFVSSVVSFRTYCPIFNLTNTSSTTVSTCSIVS